MTDDTTIAVPDHLERKAWVTKVDYETWYEQSITEPEAFWGEQAEQFLTWSNTWSRVSDCDYETGRVRWFEGGKLNVSVNCVDRHLPHRADDVAIIWEGDNPTLHRNITYLELYYEVCKCGNVLRKLGIKKGDRVAIYLPMVPEAVVAMLACARIGAVHSVVFGGFSAHALRDRILDSECIAIITADAGLRGGRISELKAHVDDACESCQSVKAVLVVKHTGTAVAWKSERDVWYDEAMATAAVDCTPEEMDAEDPLFTLYTSGSTGKPKGVLHTTAGYLLYAAMTHKYVFDYHDSDVYWCTADIGWITGHSYVVYGPLCNGATTLLFEGVPTYPDPGRFWEIVDKHKVSIFYTAPTAIRALISYGDEPVRRSDRRSLRLLGTVGEPMNPEVWNWYYNAIGEGRCPIVDTWWQTETGGILITPLPGATALKPGSATLPFFGVQPALLDDHGNEVQGAGAGALVIKRSWPGQMRTVYGDHQRFIDTYLKPYPGYYFTGDGARRDKHGYYWITGRIDDVINVAGHRLGTAEIESALVLHPHVAEAAVVGYPHPLKGQGVYAFVTLMQDMQSSEELRHTLVQLVRSEISPIAAPDVIQFAPGLPKTRSGKIMRRILRRIAASEFHDLGDTSTLAEPAVVNNLIEGRQQP